ncbi:Na(+)-translocating NADH-quinone reductase subunit C [Marinomonas sp. M1K-6]|uniref:Na(+)-translocating NADH-quinone reductase subunit C n=1 Tax=Marinomonas profundi TaxID=2726122 RepID=A0A847R018_9GAMM|nr:Na(+)-translocating NADH-quinone reductase subunit C [Marinomonas profundi]NLQ16771.1 Na(+)-translocating NADH-quinone reductase subunit C [Marinomonas profundi]UDV02505.1 Na(+)-translocating NADH-quinone reductase subunit C [Marinomonas profundi]
MASSNDSIKKTIIVALALCLVCSIFVAAAAVGLKPIQKANKDLDRKRNILSAAGMLEPGKTVDEIFETVETRIVNLQTGKFATQDELQSAGINAATFDQQAAAKDPQLSVALSGDEDPAGIKRRSNFSAVYLVKSGDDIERIILPVHGYGLWSTMYGFMALQNDFNTVLGFGFYDQGETPGLGGEVDNPNWKAQWVDKKVYNEQGEAVIELAKSSVDSSDPKAMYKVDGLSGATLTSRGVTHLVQYWLGQEAFGPFLSQLRSEGVQ